MKHACFEELMNEVRLLYNSLVRIGDDLHADRQMSMGMRAVLEFLAREGDTTVPQMARARRVSRQRIQTIVNALLAKRLVHKVENPATKRSHLISISAEGLAVIQSMQKAERALYPDSIEEKRVLKAIKTLKEIRLFLEGSQ